MWSLGQLRLTVCVYICIFVFVIAYLYLCHGVFQGGQLECRWINSYERLTLSEMGALLSQTFSQMGAS